MQRALSSGVTGMLTNQLALDVTSNNLANVNTPGFKGSRVTFASSLIQTTFSGAAAGNNVGGQNPRQVGLGVDGASIEVDMGQGALSSTGRTLDLAIQGEGFFEVTDGTRSFYTRVGNFGLDEENNLVHLSTGYRLIGNVYNLDVGGDGNQTLAATAEPLDVPVDDAFPPNRTSEIEFQGNLDSGTPALRGSNLTSMYPLRDVQSGQTATEDTPLLNLNIFAGQQVAPSVASDNPADDIVTMYVYGTRPDGEAYAGTFEINPWAAITTGSNKGTVGELVTQMNQVFAQGSDRFANARLENGNLLINSLGSGDGFSVFFGEGEPDIDADGNSIVSNNPILSKSAHTIGALFSILDALTANTPATIGPQPVADNADVGLIDPRFTVPAEDITQPIGVSVRVNGVERGNIVIPAANYTDSSVGDRTFRLPSFPAYRHWR